MDKPLLGILGGVGPLATARFMEMIIRRTPASRDQDHLPMIIINDPQIPDRTAHILNSDEDDPLPEMIAVAQCLEHSGANYIAIPCNTAHYFYDAIARSVQIPVLDIMAETAARAAQFVDAHEAVGLMATAGTVASGVFQSRLKQQGLDVVVPDQADQDLLGQLIYDGVKAGRTYDPNEMLAVASRLHERGCGAVIVGCTELSVIAHDLPERPTWLLDSLEALADRCVAFYFDARKSGTA